MSNVAKEKLKIYFAAPLFSRAELAFNEEVVFELQASFNVYLPQRDGGLMAEMVRDGRAVDAAASAIFKRDINAILNCDVVIAVLDGRCIDEGVAFEIGFAFAHSKRCVGLQTDPRRLMPSGNNPMIERALERVFLNIREFWTWAEDCLLMPDARCASNG